jgi:molybdopterin molybdotransferase
VYRLPRVCILTTGQELREAGESVAPHQIRDSNGPMLAAALSAAGFCADVRKRLPDEPDAITRGLRAALDGGDVVITVGGVSVGRYDHVPACIVQAGGSIRFHHVAIRPGKPLLFATTKQGRLIWGLPGNPVSAMVAFHEFVLPSLLMLAGLSATESRTVFRLPLREIVRTKGKVQTYHLARAISDDNGTGVVPVPGTGSADLIALGKADGAFAVPAGVTELRAGALVAFRPWRGTP